MTGRLWFVMPVHGRLELTAICLRQLRRTCDQLEHAGLEATAVIVGDDENLNTAVELGFGTVERENDYLARKFNDGIQLALDANLNPHPADWVVPFGSDDWIDHRIIRALPGPDEVLCFRHVAFVDENGRELTPISLAYDGGVGIRIYPRRLLEPTGYRPADEDRKRGCDTSILWNTRQEHNQAGRGLLRIRYGDRHPLQIVDWKTHGQQMNSYDAVGSRHAGTANGDPFVLLEPHYPQEAIAEMKEHYRRA